MFNTDNRKRLGIANFWLNTTNIKVKGRMAVMDGTRAKRRRQSIVFLTTYSDKRPCGAVSNNEGIIVIIEIMVTVYIAIIAQ